MATLYGPWESYTQTNVPEILIAYDSISGGLDGGDNPAIVSFLRSNDGSTPANDPSARTCALTHVIFGSSMNCTSWTITGGSCPTMTPGLSSASGFGGPFGTGLAYTWSNGIFGSLAGEITAVGRIAFAYAIANKTLSNGMPAWQDPTFPPEDPAPTLTAIPDPLNPGTDMVVPLEYQPFSTLSATADMTDVGSVTADRAFEIVGNEVPYGTESTTWQNGATGTTQWIASIGTDGSYTISGGPQTVPNAALQEGVAWQFVASCLAPGFFGIGNDPGIADWSIWGIPTFIISGNRTGLRRWYIPGEGPTLPCPPLAQRQRTDGLGGGPPRTGKGNVGRQSLLYARGIF